VVGNAGLIVLLPYFK